MLSSAVLKLLKFNQLKQKIRIYFGSFASRTTYLGEHNFCVQSPIFFFLLENLHIFSDSYFLLPLPPFSFCYLDQIFIWSPGGFFFMLTKCMNDNVYGTSTPT